MPILKGKLARTALAGVTVGALVLAIAAPSAAFGQAITLRRSCTGDMSCAANTNVAIPIAAQLSSQSATLDPSVTNTQSNDLDQSADNANHGIAANILAQHQTSSQSGGDQSSDLSNHQDADAHAGVWTQGGDTAAIGPNAIVHFDLSQSSDASVNGDATASQTIGQAGGNASASGDVSANGGSANGSGAATGGSGNGNSLAASLAAQLHSGNGHASTDADAGDGGNARARSGSAEGTGGDGGNGGSASTGGNGNGSIAADLAASIAAVINSRDGNTGTSGDASAGPASNTAGSGAGTGGAGAAGGTGTGTSGASTATGGAGGSADGNTSSGPGTATNTSGAAASNSTGDNGNAAVDGHGGTANGGGGNGNVAAGGNGTITGNSVDARLVGGFSQNNLGVTFSQSGSANAQGGSTSNTGSAAANPILTANLDGRNTQTNTQTPTQTGTNGDVNQDQTSRSDQTATLHNEAINRARGAIDQTRSGANTATAGDQTNAVNP